MKGRYPVNIPYFSLNPIKVTILHECVRNLIKADPIQGSSYEITDSESIIGIKMWSYNMSQCGPVIYSSV